MLSVDDSEANRYLRNRALSKAGFVVIDAATGADALELAAEEQPCLILLDIRLPDMDGFEVCRLLKSDPKTRAIPILHVTAVGRPEVDMPEALEHRSDAFLREPVEPETLVATVTALIRAREAEFQQHEAEERADMERRRVEDRLRASERRLGLALEAAQAGTWEYDLDTGRNSWDERLGQLLGVTPEALAEAGQRWLEFVVPEDRARVEADFAAAVGAGRLPYLSEFRVRRTDGEVRWVQSRGILANGPGSARRLVGILQDITERKQAEETERHAVERYERQVRLFEGVASTTPDFVYLFDLEGRFLYANRRLLEVWGMQLRDAVGKTCRELGYQQWHHDMHMREIAQVIETKRPIKGEVPFRAPLTGIFGIYEYIFTPVLGPDGEVDFIAGTTRDVTERKRSEEALRESEERFRTLFTSMSEGFGLGELIYDSDGRPVDHRFLEINDAFRRQTGIGGEIVGRPMREVLPNVEQVWHDTYHRVAETGEPVRFEQYGRDTGRYYSTYCFSPSPGRFAVLFRDITAEKRTEEALRKSEARLSTALDHLGEGVIIVTRTGDLVYWNAAAREMHGSAGPDEVGGPIGSFADIFELWTADGQARIPFEEWPVLRIARGETVRNLELHLRRPDQGWERVVCFNGAMLESASGEQLIYLSIYDLTAQRKAEQELLDRERQFRELADSVPHLVWIADGAGRATYFNRRWYEQLAVGPEESLGERWAELLHPEDRRRTLEHWHSCVASGERYEIECRFRVVGGEYRWFLGRGAPFRDEGGRIVRWVGTCTDIEENKRAEERLRQTQKLESVGLLAGGIAHDFNNLLTGIMGNASLALEEVGPGPAERIREVLAGAERAAHLTRQLLAYSGKGQFVVDDIDVSQTVQEMADLAEFSVPRSVDLSLNVQRRLPSVRMDPSQFQQVLMNLVINAGEAVGEGNPGRITISTSMMDLEKPFTDAAGQQVSPGRYVCLEVCDTGSGIDESSRSKIFDPFYTTKFAGRGMGLAATAGIVRSQKGAIMVESTPGHGSTFRVLLPVSGDLAHHAEGAQPDARTTVLVVDDEPSVRDFIAAVLERKGYRALKATDGRDALAIIEREKGRIELLVLDVVMPVMGANELLPAIKAREAGLKVLMTSGYSESEAKRLCAAYPGSAFIQKPYTARQIANAVEGLLGPAG